jgi:hypothetical protein
MTATVEPSIIDVESLRVRMGANGPPTGNQPVIQTSMSETTGGNGGVAVKRVSAICALLALGLGVGPAPAGEKCFPVNGFFGAGTYLPASECPTYEGPGGPRTDMFCIVQPVLGTLTGTWYAYLPTPNTITVTPAEQTDPVWRPGKSMMAGWYYSVYKTKRGTIYAEASVVAHSELMPPEAPYFTFSEFDRITGGTGKYKDATGWIGVFGDEANGGPMGGKVCLPR